jgi:hypothetical protein
MKEDLNTTKEELTTTKRELGTTQEKLDTLLEEFGKAQQWSATKRIHLRLRVLEEWRTNNPDERARGIVRVGNKVAHGGDIVADIEAILSCEKKGLPHVKEYKETFGLMYEVGFDEAMKNISPAGTQLYPVELVQTYDIIATAKALNHWKGSSQGRAVIQLSREIITQFRAVAVEDQPKCFQHHDLKDKFNTLYGMSGVAQYVWLVTLAGRPGWVQDFDL